MIYAGAGALFPADVPGGIHPLLSSFAGRTPTDRGADAGQFRPGAGGFVLFEKLVSAWIPQSSEINAVYNSDTDIPITSNGYTASENSVKFTLNHTPATGVELMVVKNTGLNFINGTFSNLAQGQAVNLSYGGFVYHFVANYYGGTGNDLVLVWADSSVVSWGRGSQGELGEDNEIDRQVPVLVYASDEKSALFNRTVTGLSSGGGHCLALTSDGWVAAWGDNSYGQLGENSGETQFFPVRVSTDQETSFLFGKTVVAVAAGSSHSLALCSDGRVASWGSNFGGALGNRTTQSRSLPGAVYTADNDSALFGKTVVAISAGNGHSLALCSDGTVAAWGEFGGDEGGNRLKPFAVRRTEGSALFGKTVVAISAGGRHSLALCSDGTIAAWGYNYSGQLGSGVQSDDPYNPSLVDTGEGSALYRKFVIAISAGRDHSLALCSDGTVASWGSNAYGQLGVGGTLEGSYSPVAVSAVQGASALFGKTVVGISAGSDHSLARCSDGTAAAWGGNGYGQLGDGTEEPHRTPVAVSDKDDSVLLGRKVMTLSAGDQHNVALAAAPSTTSLPTVAFEQPTSAAEENAGTVTVEVVLSGLAQSDVLVPYTVSGTASGEDATVAASPLVIPAGAGSGFITVDLVTDPIYDDGETVVITLGTPSGAGLGSLTQHTLTITDNQQPMVAFAGDSSTAGENAGTVEVTVSLSGPSAWPVTVPFTVSGTASSSDATVAASPLVIPAGETSGTISVTITDDVIYENMETVVINLGTPSGAGLGSTVQYTLMIVENDPVPTVAFAQEGSTVDEGAGTVTVEVALSGLSASPITLPFTVSGTASGSDATVAASPLVIPAGATGGSISVTITDDTLFENVETVALTLGTPAGAGLGSTRRHTMAISDNEDIPLLAFAQAASTAAENAGTVNVAVTLSGPSASDITVPFTVTGTASGADAAVAASPLVILAGATAGTIAVTITNDTLFENAETVILTLGTPTGAGLGSNVRHTLTITDNEEAPTVAFAAATSTAGENAGTVNVAVTLSGPSASDITVPFTVTGTASGADAAVAASPLVIPAGATGGTIAVTVTDDTVYENAESVILTLGTPAGAGLRTPAQHALTITDNEEMPAVTFAEMASTVGESAGTVNVAVTLSGRSASDITVPFTVTGTASGADAAVASSPLVIPAGMTGGIIAVSITDDTLFENAETVVLTLGTPGGAELGGNVRHTLTITDNEGVPTVAFAQATSTAAESAGTVNVAVVLSGASSADVTVPFTVTGTASGSDAVVASSPLVIPAGATGGMIVVTIAEDTLYENAETVILNFGVPTGAGLGSTAQHTLTITDNEEAPIVTFAETASTAGEGAGTVNVAVTLSGVSSSDITVPFTVAGTASGADFTAAVSPLVIPAGATGGIIAVTITDDAIYENAETVILTLAIPSGAGLGSTVRHTLTITDNESAPTVAFAEAASTVGESAGAVNVGIALSGPSSSDITVTFTVTGTASGLDAAVASSPLVIPAGATGGIIAVTISDDAIYENAETVVLSLGTPTGAGLGSTVRHTLTITDNESLPTVAFAEATSTAGESAGMVTVVVSLSGPSASQITVPFAVSGTASGSDAAVAASPLVIPAGAAGGTIAVSITDDSLYENPETVILTLGTPTGAGMGSNARHTLTITDNEGVPTVAFAQAASTAAENAGTVNVAVTLSGSSSTDVSVPFSVSGTASGSDFTVASSPLVIPAGATGGTIAVFITDDSVYENAETVILALGAPTGAGLGSAARHTLTISDNENQPTVTFAQTASTAGESAGTVNVAVTVSGASSSDITVPFTVTGTATSADAAVATSPLVISAGATSGTIAVAITDDTLYENAETVILNLGTPAGAGLGGTMRHTLTITDNESAPTVAFAETVSTAGESAGTVNVGVTLSGRSASDITVPFTVAGTASGTDFTVAASPLVIPAGATGGNVALTITDDALYENAETVILSLGTPTGAGLGSTVRHTLTLTDNENVPTVAFAEAAAASAENGGTIAVAVTLSGRSSTDIIVPFTVSGTASGSDATVAASPLVIPAGATGGSIALTLTDDVLYENAETVILALGPPAGAGLGSIAQHTRTITDNDPQPSISLTAAGTLAENGAPLTATVALNAPSGLPVTVDLDTSGSAVRNVDYQISASTVTIPAGGTSATFTVTPVNDKLPEADKTIVLTLANPVNTQLGNPSTRSIVLTDDNDAGLNALTATSSGPVTEGAGAATLTFKVDLARLGDGPVSVRYAFSGTATPVVDYAGASGGVLTFTGTESEKTVTVTVLDDPIYEPEETVILTLSNPSGGVISIGAAVGTIVDNESVPVITLFDAGTVSDAGPGTVSAVFHFQLSGPSATAVTLPWSLVGGSASAGEDFRSGSGVVTFAPGATSSSIEAGIINDNLLEGTEAFYLQPGTPVGAILPGSGQKWFPDQALSTSTEVGAEYGKASAMQDDVLAVSAPEGNGGKGEVIVFSRTASGWEESPVRLSLPDGAAGDEFGYSVAVWGDWLLAGAIGRDGAGSDSGAAYVFRRSRSGWSLVQQLEAPGARQNDYFGWGVAIHQSTLAVSARLHSTGKGPRGNEGAVYVYELVDGTWVLSREVAATGTTAQSLGGSLALYGDTLAAGAPDDDTRKEDAGAVYLFERNAGGTDTWGQVGKFQNGSGASPLQRFGGAVSLWGKTLAVGSTSGSTVNVFDRTSAGTWENTAILSWDQAIPAGNFGAALHLAGDMLAVGGAKTGGTAGSANLYFYQRNAAREWTQAQKLDSTAGIPTPGGGYTAGVAGWGSEFAVGGVEGTTGKTAILRNEGAAAFINEGPPASTPQLQLVNGELMLSWDPVPGAIRYEVEGSEDLLNWENLADVHPPTTSWTVPVTPGARQYFRIKSHY